MVRVKCVKEFELDGKKHTVGPVVAFELDGEQQSWKSGEERTIPEWAWQTLERRQYRCFQLVGSVGEPEQGSETKTPAQ